MERKEKTSASFANRTGTQTSPVDSAEMARAAGQAATGDPFLGTDTIARVRGLYADGAEPLGSVPAPVTIKGAAGAALQALKGDKLHVLIDRMGQRLAFERTGVRLYEGVIAKVRSAGKLPEGAPSEADLQDLRDDEYEHFELLRVAMERMGADPTAITPAADVAAVTSLGILQVVGDPRTSVLHTLEAMLSAELTDNDGWDLLIRLADEMGHKELASQFESALETEVQHLARVREWVSALAYRDAGVS